MRPERANQPVTTAVLKKGIITRSKKVANTTMKEGKEREVPKRKAECSPAKQSLKRSAFGDITNVSNISPCMN
jgi:16S rRNA U516 pseudouridylate synthase RsuA-like enzyme